MSTSTAKQRMTPKPLAARVTGEMLYVDLADGRTLGVPVAWYPRLAHGTAPERNRVEIGAMGLHWPDLDEDIEIEGLLLGERSGESATSFARWLSYRNKGELPPVPTFPRRGDSDASTACQP